MSELSCTLGAQCEIALTGHNLVDANGLVILAEGQCGDADAVVADWGEAVTEISVDHVAGSIDGVSASSRRALALTVPIPSG